MFRWQSIVGVALGLAIALTAITFNKRTEARRDSAGRILSEIDGRLREVVIHYEPSTRDISLPVYREFLAWMDNATVVDVVTPSRAAYDELISALGPIKCRLRPIIVNHAITTWSRDRWLALSPAEESPDGAITVWNPHGEALAASWPERAGDQQAGFDLAQALAPAARARRSSLYFDGGDFLADDDNVFVAPRVLPRNVQVTVQDRAELVKIFSEELRRPVILLNEAPDHHAAMFMASIGNKTVLVGDPNLARHILSDEILKAMLPGGGDFTSETQRLFDAVASQASDSGYRVVRVPVIPGVDGRTFLTYVNCIIERFGGKQIVYLPFYRGAEPLNTAARKIWEDLGYEVRLVDCTTAYPQYGALHCLVNILRRQSS